MESDPTLRIEETVWANGRELTVDEREHIKALRDAGCVCLWPLLGFKPRIGPRCRLCNKVGNAPNLHHITEI